MGGYSIQVMQHVSNCFSIITMTNRYRHDNVSLPSLMYVNTKFDSGMLINRASERGVLVKPRFHRLVFHCDINILKTFAQGQVIVRG